VRSKPFAPAPSGPSATVKVSPPASTLASMAGVSSRYAVRAPPPAKRTAGVALSVASRLTPVFRPAGFFANVHSSGVTFVPETASGTSMVSPATSVRPRLIVNCVLPPSLTVTPLPGPSRLTTVGSSSTIVTVCVLFGAFRPSPATASGRDSVAEKVSSGSSSPSPRRVRLTAWLDWPEAMAGSGLALPVPVQRASPGKPR